MNANEGYYDPKKNEKGFNSYYDEFHFLLGKIVVSINLIEFQIMKLICNFTNQHDIEAAFSACKKKRATQLLESLNELIHKKIHDSNILSLFNKLNGDLKKVINHRNDFMHSLYIDSPSGENKLTRKIKRVRRIGLRDFTKGDKNIDSYIIYNLISLRGLVQWLDHLYNELDKFINLLQNERIIKSISLIIPKEPEFLKKSTE
jgi:hypothetical protein